MVMKKEVMKEPTDLWKQELIKPITINQYAKEIANTQKIIVYGESNTGKTSLYFGILNYLKEQGMKKEDLLMCVIYPDRPTGITKLFSVIPKEYRDCVLILPINNYEELVSSTAIAVKKLQEHKQQTGKLGWLVCELLESSWQVSQDYYCRLAYGETMGQYFAKKRADVKAMQEDTTAYKSLEGWGDWPIIKYFHNFNWIDRIKRLPYNVLFTAEVKMEGNKDSIFFDLGYRPAGEKDNMHRVDTILYLSHKGNEFFMQPYKATGYKRLYSKQKITGKNAYKIHMQALEELTKRGFGITAMQELEKKAGIIPPIQETQKKTIVKKENDEKNEQWDI